MWSLRKQLLIEATQKFREEKPEFGSFKDYQDALNKHLVSYSEYMYQYEFWRLNEAQRSEFISRAQVRGFYYDIPWNIKNIFWNKSEFLLKFSPYIHRQWLCAQKCSYEVFKSFIIEHECVIKPLDNCCGFGIAPISALQKKDSRVFYDYCCANNLLIEERIQQCDELASFHPASINSIRVVTVRKGDTPIVFGAFLRMGCHNSFVDNAHAGGLFAQINIDSGIIESDGISVNGSLHTFHPDSLIRIKGFKIPQWDKIKAVCIKAADVIKENPITGWDVVINRQGIIEFIEGNHGPDFDVMQSPLKMGVKKRLLSCINK